MKVRALIAVISGAAVFASACSDHEFEPPDRSERVQRAAATYSSTLFDSVAWDDDEIRLSQGNAVYAAECRRCHGPLGRGTTDYARQRNLTVPSLVAPDWPLGEADSLRRTIFTGHESGMPVFGDGNLTPRDIDATSAYILQSLRPDVLELD